jgi:hypothetical protein
MGYKFNRLHEEQKQKAQEQQIQKQAGEQTKS